MTGSQSQYASVGSERAVELQNAEELMKEIIIPPRPSILVDVLNEQSKSDPNLHRIAELISKDVAISAGVLRVVNSSFFGLPRKIGSIDHAVRLIGVRSVTNIVTALMLHSAFGDNKGRFMDEFWNESGRLAAAASFASRLSGDVPTEEAYSLGLFANCGVPLMLRKFNEYPAVYERAQTITNQALTSYEEAELGTDHTLVGYIMGKNWELPESFCQCILRHHDATNYYTDPNEYLEEITPYLAVLQLGQFFTRAYDEKPHRYEWERIGPEVCEYFGITSERLEGLKAEAIEEIGEAGGIGA